MTPSPFTSLQQLLPPALPAAPAVPSRLRPDGPECRSLDAVDVSLMRLLHRVHVAPGERVEQQHAAALARRHQHLPARADTRRTGQPKTRRQSAVGLRQVNDAVLLLKGSGIS